MIDLRNVEKTYPSAVPVKALRGISLSVMEGEFIALMGRSGSGKSTLLHQLGLLDIPTAGTIILNGQDVSLLSSHEKSHFRLEKIGYIFQEFALLSEFTALENVSLPLMAKHGQKISNTAFRAEKILEQVGLGERQHHFPSQLSGGEQQRLAIARALINEPKIILADEPTASLDSESSAIIMKLLAELNRDFHQTIIMVSHEPEDRRWVSRTIWLKDGYIERDEGKIKK